MSPLISRGLVFITLSLMAFMFWRSTENRYAVQLHSIHQPGWLIQKDQPVVIKGISKAGSQVHLKLGHHQTSVTANDNGRWQATLPALQAQMEPLSLNVSNRFGHHQIISPVHVGSLWFCSGQSNAVISIERLLQTHYNAKRPLQVNARHHLKAATKIKDAQIHLFVNDRPQGDARSTFFDLPGKWMTWGTESSQKASALGVLFAQEWRKAHPNEHIGIIFNGVSGMPLESFVPPSLLHEVPVAYKKLSKRKHQKAPSWWWDWPIFLAQRVWWHIAQHLPIDKPRITGKPRHPLESYDTPTALFRGMIEPLQHFPAEGVIWYQGESNTSGETVQHNYSKLLSLFLQHWRQGSKQPSFKSILVPITGFGAENQAAELNHQWCDIRQQIIDLGQQDLTWAIPSHDTGQVNNVHPINKSDLAQRAALAAMQQDPDLFIKPTVTAHLHNGRWELTSRQPWFIQRKTRETLGPQQKQHQGSAVGFSVVTFQDDVQNIEGSLLPSGNIRLQHFNDIKTIRYAWSGNPVDANLLDDKGFPIQPFKIDVAQ